MSRSGRWARADGTVPGSGTRIALDGDVIILTGASFEEVDRVVQRRPDAARIAVTVIPYHRRIPVLRGGSL